MYLGSTESIKLFLEHTDCLGIVSIRSITRELYSGQLRVVEIKGMPMLRDFSFAQPQGQESGLAQVFMQFAMHNNNKLLFISRNNWRDWEKKPTFAAENKLIKIKKYGFNSSIGEKH